MSIQVGDHAPDFTLKSTIGEEPVQLSKLRGEKNVVLLFFPLAWTGVCTKEMCSIRDGYDQYADLDAEVFGLSVDSPFALGAWSKEQGFNFALLSDFNREATEAYGVVHEDLIGLKNVSKRSAFVIDKQGVVQYAEVCPSPGDLPSFDKIQETLRGLS